MDYGRATHATKAKSTRRGRVAVLVSVTASMLAATTPLAASHLSAMAGRDLIASMHAAWIRIAAPGMQLPAGRLNPRAVKIRIACLSVCYLPLLNSRFCRISGN